MRDNHKNCLVHTMEMLEGQNRQKGTEKNIWNKNDWEFSQINDTNPQNKEAQRTEESRINIRKQLWLGI